VTKKATILALIKEVLYNSLAQAVIKIILTPHLLIKAVLTVCVLCSTGLASYLVIQSIIEYFTYGVTTASRTIFETPTLFPKVTFCNVNKYTTEFAFNYTTFLSKKHKRRVWHPFRPMTRKQLA